MAASPDLTPLLACPRCAAGPLEVDGDGHRCGTCGTAFPSFDVIPWLFAEPAAARGEWQQRWHLHLSRLEHDRERYARALADATGATRERLLLLSAAVADQGRRLRELLAPLGVDRLASSYATQIALRTRMPSDQGLVTYYNNIHRDWCWGAEENESAFRLIAETLAGHPTPAALLVLGAGAGRLAYDLHQGLKSTATVALDFNPLLVLLGHRISQGETLRLYEFPLAPRSIADHAILRTLAADEAARPGLFFVLGDALHAPFAAAAFDTVLTPWLVDILPATFDAVCARVNALLPTGGRWVNFGSLSFQHADPAQCFGIEECLEALTRNGFVGAEVRQAQIPYMCSPASRHGRREEVVVWQATKRSAAPLAAPHSALPAWIVNGREPVPLLASFRMQAASTRIYAFLMSTIDGRRSLADIARLLVEQRLMSAEEAEPAVRSFLIKMYEDSRRAAL